MDIIFFYALAGIALIGSYAKDKKKTRQGVAKAWKAFENILPAFATLLLVIGIMLAVVSPAVVSTLLGRESGFAGMLIAGVVGSVTLIPGFIAFPLAKAILDMGAGILQIAVFVSTLMMVGIVTAPLESRYFSPRIALYRNSFSFVFAFIVAYVLWMVIGR
jgi:Predicted permease.